jgi:hypothetical protein
MSLSLVYSVRGRHAEYLSCSLLKTKLVGFFILGSIETQIGRILWLKQILGIEEIHSLRWISEVGIGLFFTRASFESNTRRDQQLVTECLASFLSYLDLGPDIQVNRFLLRTPEYSASSRRHYV